MYSSGCGRRGPSVPRRYYALLLATADFSTVRSTVRKNINYKDYPNNWVRKYCEQKDYTNKREYTCWLMQWEIYQVYLQETTVGCELFQVKLIMLYFSLVSKIACVKILLCFFFTTIGVLHCVSLLFSSVLYN